MEEDSEVRMIELYYPGKKFPSISVSGYECKLDCAHCGGRYLHHMLNVDSPLELLELCGKLNSNEVTGALISGGCDQNGHVMLDGYTEILKQIKLQTNLVLNVHTGLISESQAIDLAKTGIDAVSIDIIGDSDTINKVYGLNYSILEYKKSIQTLKSAGIKKIVPHICVGLDFGDIKGEFKAIDLVTKIKLNELVFIILTPTKGTKMENCYPPSLNKVMDVINYAKLKLINPKIYLGCMRPRMKKYRKYNNKLEKNVIDIGINGIVLPSKSALDYIKNKNIIIKKYEICCAAR